MRSGARGGAPQTPSASAMKRHGARLHCVSDSLFIGRCHFSARNQNQTLAPHDLILIW